MIPKDAENFYIAMFDKFWALLEAHATTPGIRLQNATRHAAEAVKAVYGKVPDKELLEGAERE